MDCKKTFHSATLDFFVHQEYKPQQCSVDSPLLWREQKSSLQWKKLELPKVNYKIKLNLYRELILLHFRIQGREKKQGFPFQVSLSVSGAGQRLAQTLWLTEPQGLWGKWTTWDRLIWVIHHQNENGSSRGSFFRSQLHWCYATSLCPGVFSSVVPMEQLEMGFPGTW